MGVVVPSGEGDVVFEFHPLHFGLSLSISLLAAAVLGIVAAAPSPAWTLRKRKP
jgi:hypothetical protein